jgi:ABC-type antimicrobial peptide transport system permease subunit
MQEVDDVVGVLNMLGIISMVVAGFLVSNVINTIIVEQRQQIGILKAIGATRWETFLIYAGMALVYGMIGTFFGILLAIPATAIMARALTELAQTYIDDFRLSARGLGIGAAMGLLVPVAFAIGVRKYDGQLYPLLMLLAALVGLTSLLRMGELGGWVLLDVALLGAIFWLALQVQRRVFPNINWFSVRKDARGSHIW